MSRKANTSGEIRIATGTETAITGVDLNWIRSVVAQPAPCQATWPQGGTASWVLGYRRAMLSLATIGLEILDGTWLSPLSWSQRGSGGTGIDGAFAQWAQRNTYPVRSVRIGVLTPGAWSESLMAMPASSSASPWIDIEWISCPTNGHALSACRDYKLDAVVQSLRDDGFGVYTCEHPGKSAALTSWSEDGPLSYAGLFPLRVDASSLMLSGVEPAEMGLARSLLVAMAVCSRHPQRLTAWDVIGGRLPTTSREAWPKHVATVRGDCHWTLQAMRHVARELVSVLENRAGVTAAANATASMTVRAAARCISAWATSAVTAIHDQERHALTSLAMLACPEDAVIASRHCATLVAMGDDVAGRERLKQLTEMLAIRTFVEDIDHSAFVLGELAQCGSPLSTGRLAVGCCILANTLDARGFEYAREDLMDEIKRSGAMIEREADQAMVISLLRGLQGRGATKKRHQTKELKQATQAQEGASESPFLTKTGSETGHEVGQEVPEDNFIFERAREKALQEAVSESGAGSKLGIGTGVGAITEAQPTLSSVGEEANAEAGEVVRTAGKGREKVTKSRKRTRKAA